MTNSRAFDWKNNPKDTLLQHTFIPIEYTGLIPVNDSSLTDNHRKIIAKSMVMFPHAYLIHFSDKDIVSYETFISKKSKNEIARMFEKIHTNGLRTSLLDAMFSRILPAKSILFVDKNLAGLPLVSYVNSGLSALDYVKKYEHLSGDKNHKFNIVDAYIELCNTSKLTGRSFAYFVEIGNNLTATDLNNMLQTTLRSGKTMLDYMLSQTTPKMIEKYFDYSELYYVMRKSSLKYVKLFYILATGGDIKDVDFPKHQPEIKKLWCKVGSPRVHSSLPGVFFIGDKQQIEAFCAYEIKSNYPTNPELYLHRFKTCLPTEFELMFGNREDVDQEELRKFMQDICRNIQEIPEEELLIDF